MHSKGVNKRDGQDRTLHISFPRRGNGCDSTDSGPKLGQVQGPRPGHQHRGCTALIQSGQESTTDQASAYYNRGIAYHDKKDLDPALRDLNQALSLKADFAGALNSRGNVYSDLRASTDRAIADYNEAMRLDPNYKLAYYNRGNAWADKGQ